MNEDKFFMNNLFGIVKNLFSGNEIVYISTPINTGERFLHWYNSVGKKLIKNSAEYNKEKTKNVVEPNVKNVNECIKKIRQTTGKVIIDPTTLENETLQWSQNQFYQFWDRVIKDLVNEIIFLDGWEYSVGCCCEYLSALESNIKIYNQSMEILSLVEAKRRISKSINIYEAYQLQEGSQITNILNKLLKYKRE